MVTAESNIVLELLNRVVEFFASVSLEQFSEPVVAESPGIKVNLVILPSRNGRSNFVCEGHVSDFRSLFSVSCIFKARMIHVFNTITGSQDAFTDVIEVRNLSGEPWDFRSTSLGHSN